MFIGKTCDGLMNKGFQAAVVWLCSVGNYSGWCRLHCAAAAAGGLSGFLCLGRGCLSSRIGSFCSAQDTFALRCLSELPVSVGSSEQRGSARLWTCGDSGHHTAACAHCLCCCSSFPPFPDTRNGCCIRYGEGLVKVGYGRALSLSSWRSSLVYFGGFLGMWVNK